MREIAYTTLGRNALSTGLVSHIAGLVAGMMTVSGAQTFSPIAYGLACLSFAFGVYKEMKERGYAPVTRSLGSFLAAAASVLPVIGPIAVLLTLYAAQGKRKGEPFNVGGLLISIPRLKVNPLVLFLFLVILFVFFALSIIQDDPYFNKAKEGKRGQVTIQEAVSEHS